ncbi:MAG: hypothetical protein FWG94_07075 [Oscillospiraceae bacterium]|nr:hypothetical protein [Oscillospiraceae bacterium]
MAYSTEIREKALVQCQNGASDDEITAKFGMSKQTLGNWKKLLFTTGSLEKKKVKRKSGNPYKYKPEKIKALLDKSKTSATSYPPLDSSTQEYLKASSRKKSKKKKNKF